MDNELFDIKRKSHIELDEIYFWTATIRKWIQILKPDEMKEMMRDSPEHLSNTEKTDSFNFVKIPNHITLSGD